MIPATTFADLLRVAVLSLTLSAPGDAAAQQGAVYERRAECVQAGALTPEQCDFAYRNARAEFEQKAPRYAGRAACVKAHGACAAQIVSAGGWESFGRGGATYVPRFAGVRIVGEGAGRKALPVVAGGRIGFAGRSLAVLDDKVAGRRATIGLVASRGRTVHDGRATAGAPKRGDRDDTMRVPMEHREMGSNVAPGLYVDSEGVEWYKPARPR